jgi:hypothetical protein
VLGIELCGENVRQNAYKLLSNSHIKVHLHSEDEPSKVVETLASNIGETGFYFASYKNYARYVIDLERLARENVGKLLAANYARIVRSRLSPWRRTRGMRDSRHARIESSKQVALLWLLIAATEATRRDWTGARRTLKDKSTVNGISDLFLVDMRDDEETVLSLDLSFIKSAIEQSATRSDSQTMVWATASGAALAVVGGVTGAIIGAMIQGSAN